WPQALFTLAAGIHPQRELTLMPRLGFACPRLGIAAGAPIHFAPSSALSFPNLEPGTSNPEPNPEPRTVEPFGRPRPLGHRARCPHQKRGTLHDPQNKRRPSVVLGGCISDDAADRRPIEVLEAPPEGVRQEFFRHGAGKLIGLLEEQSPQARKSLDLRTARRRPARVDRLPRLVDGPPP